MSLKEYVETQVGWISQSDPTAHGGALATLANVCRELAANITEIRKELANSPQDHGPYTGLRCPACGSFDIGQHDTLNHGAVCTIQSWCVDCEAHWTATYLFDQIENLEVPEFTDETEA